MQSTQTPIRLGTRGSLLAMAQAEQTRDRLVEVHGLDPDSIAIVPFQSSGDRLADRPLSEIGGKGLFTKEIDRALLDGQVDIGVHSAKDVATELPEGMAMPAFLEREDVRDAFISLVAKGVDYLPAGARFGTSSIRRAAQVKRMRPDLRIVPFRGNVQTRLQKLADGVAAATLLAMAGLNRLGEGHRITLPIEAETFLPAPAQGAIGLAVRQGDRRMRELVAPLDHAETHRAVAAERALLGVLDGSCRTPVAALARIADGRLVMNAEILSLDGAEHFSNRAEGAPDEAEAIGRALARDLLTAAGPGFVARWSAV